jgi:hypothetical protein
MSDIPMEVPTAEELPMFNKRERRHIAHLNRRRKFLVERIKMADFDVSWDKAELNALDWAVNELIRSEMIED